MHKKIFLHLLKQWSATLIRERYKNTLYKNAASIKTQEIEQITSYNNSCMEVLFCSE